MPQRYLEERHSGQDPLREDAALAEVVRRLVEAYRPEQVYLFGSKARGDGEPDSDYDLLLVVPDDRLGRAARKPLGLRGPMGHWRRCRCAGVQPFLL
jgi:predicted nucleotidyltransferase